MKKPRAFTVIQLNRINATGFEQLRFFDVLLLAILQ